jgi:HEAT repeat protein
MQPIVEEMKTTPVGSKGKLIPALLAAMPDSEMDRARNWFYLRDELRDPSVVTALTEALTTNQRAKAAAMLVGLRRNAGFTLSASDTNRLIEALSSKDALVRRDAADVLAATARSNDSAAKNALIRVLANDGDAQTRAEAASSLGDIGREEYFKNARSTADALAKAALSDTAASVRESAVLALGQLAGKAAGQGDVLAKSITDNSSTVRWRAMEAIAKIGPACKAAVPNLIEILNQPDDRVAMGDTHYYACAALAAIGPDSVSAIPSLLPVLKEPRNAQEAARALGAMGSQASQAVPGLIALLHSSDYEERNVAAVALGNIGPAASAALPDLKKAADDTRNRSRAGTTRMAQEAAQEAILKISPPP